MNLSQIKEMVYEANINLVKTGLVKLTWGNAGQLTESGDAFVIKPSGVPYETMRPDDMVLVDLKGNVLEGKWRPSSDTPTYIVLFQFFLNIDRSFQKTGEKSSPISSCFLQGIVHTHSVHATAWAQAREEIPCFGTTHADLFYGSVPLTRALTAQEVDTQYETNTGRVIVEKFEQSQLNPLEIPAVLAAGHGPFVWGKDAVTAAQNALALEEVAHLALLTQSLTPENSFLESHVLNKHYLRKHGQNAYYGQN